MDSVTCVSVLLLMQNIGDASSEENVLVAELAKTTDVSLGIQGNNCLPQRAKHEVRHVQNQIREMALNTIGADTTTSILQATLIQTSHMVKATLPNINSLKRNIQRQRNISRERGTR